ncbi:putative proteasome endopeptidase complex [Helianthus debilis subsp. tardiflorus]
MTLADDVNLEEFVMTKDEFSGADIKAICTEAGLLALRERRMKVRNLQFTTLHIALHACSLFIILAKTILFQYRIT